MAPAPSQKELLELENTKVEDPRFLDAAASFLTYDLATLEKNAFEENGDHVLRRTLAPREEFVLKLLLRRLSKSADVLSAGFWALLAHLVAAIPTKGLAHLLGERDFFGSLAEALGRVLAGNANEVLDSKHNTSSDEDSGRPTKKQRLVKPDFRKRTDPGRVAKLVCRVIDYLVHLAARSAEVDEICSNAVRNVLSAEPEEAASVTGKLLQLVRKSLTNETPDSEQQYLAEATSAILSIWTYRKSGPVNNSSMSYDQHFTEQCLTPALRLLVELKQHPSLIQTAECTIAVKALERLIALHSVLPLRSLFLEERAQQWKKKTNSIAWDDLKDLHTVVSTMLPGSHSADVETSSSSSADILQYYSIAIRAVPRPTVRRIQQEQPWLDCLFCVCAYLCNHNLPRMDINETGHLVVQSSPELQSSKRLNETMKKLLALAAMKAVKLSLPVLVYLTAAVLEMNSNNEQWRILAEILEQDVNVLIPNSGLLETEFMLSKIFEAISDVKDATEVDYAIVRDGLIRPLLKGFAQARDIKGFLSLWMRGLQDSIQQRASGDLVYGQSYPSLVWEDELLFKDFETAIKALTTSTLTQFATAEMLVLLKQATQRIGPTSDIISHIAITSSFLSARPDGFSASTLESIVNAAALALIRRSDYQSQRWRLWSLLRRCLDTAGQPTSTDQQLQQLTEKQILVSLSAVQDTGNSEHSFARDARLKEALECFHLIVSRASQSEVVGKNSFEIELDHLIALFLGTKDLKPKQPGTSPGQLEFASSCVGVILQHPQVLQRCRPALPRLIAAMIGHLSTFPSDAKDAKGLASLIKALLLSEEISNNAQLFNNCCSAVLNPVDGQGGLPPSVLGIVIELPLRALKKSLVQKLTEVLVQRVRTDVTTASSFDQVLPDLGLLTMLIASFNVSIGKPKKWAEFIDLAEHVLNCTGSPASTTYQTVLGCISKMFDVLWSRCQADEMPGDMLSGLKSFHLRLLELERSAGSHSGGPVELVPQMGSLDGSVSLNMSEVTTKELEEIATRINTQVASLGSEKSSELARLVNQDGLESRSLLLLSAIVCQTSTNDAAQDFTLLQSMGKLATLKFALTVRTAADLALGLDTCKIVLDKCPSIMNQHGLDTLLSSLAALIAPSTTQIASDQPSAIFDRLCSLLSLLLSRHRKRLGGRYHLIIPALQGLLKCLFFAGTSSTAVSQTKSQVAFIRSLPSWIRSSKKPLGPKSTEHFTRLLTMICDPSVSSVRRKKPNELTDETKKAKSLAGQYMQYLVMEYCRCSLHGRIPSSSKEKLMPGLYAVLNVMDREVMREMNGAMDSNGRAVWKGLYQDWERFGRWDKR